MAFTMRTVTHTFLNGDGTPSSGKVTAALGQRMTNSGTTILPISFDTQLSATGGLSVTLAANDDPGTTPAGQQWQITLRIMGSEEDTFGVTVPSAGSGNVDLGTLLPAVEQVG